MKTHSRSVRLYSSSSCPAVDCEGGPRLPKQTAVRASTAAAPRLLKKNSSPRRPAVPPARLPVLNTMLLTAFLATASALAAPTTIYVDQSAAPGGSGSATAPFRTISEAVDALALSNSAHFGGNTISVASGIYTEAVYLTTDHAGTPDAPNMLLGIGNPVIDGENTRARCVHLHLSTNFIVKGFHLTRATASAIRLDNNNTIGHTENWTIDSCYVYDNAIGLDVNRHSITGTTITNCAFFLNAGRAVYLQGTSDARIENSVFLFNGHGAADGVHASTVHREYAGGVPETLVWIQNSVFAGNAGDAVRSEGSRVRLNSCIFYDNGGGIYNTSASGRIYCADELLNLGYGTNSISADPGFAAIAALDFSMVYEGSPCVGSGIEGVNIGLVSLTEIPVSSNTYYVSTTGSDAYTKEQAQTPVTPWRTIQAGVNRSTAGDTLRIAAGTYAESVAITNSGTFDHPLSLIADGNVVIDGTTNAIHLYRTAGVLIDGFQIVACTTAGIEIRESYGCRLRNLDVNSDVIGLSIRALTGRNHFYRCVFRGHSTAGVSAGGTGGQNYESCDFSNNTGMGVSLGYHNGVSRFYNCNFNFNGTIGYRQSQTTMPCFLRNCNFVGNGTYGIESWYAAKPFAENCNITDNGIYGAYENIGGTTYFTNCNFYANVSGLLYDRPTTAVVTTIGALNALDENTANIAVNPLFKDPAAGNFRFQGGSPCINAGTATTELKFDYYGNPRLVGMAVDIGIYEAPPPGTFINFF